MTTAIEDDFKIAIMIFLFSIMMASAATYFGICFFRLCLAINSDNIR